MAAAAESKALLHSLAMCRSSMAEVVTRATHLRHWAAESEDEQAVVHSWVAGRRRKRKEKTKTRTKRKRPGGTVPVTIGQLPGGTGHGQPPLGDRPRNQRSTAWGNRREPQDRSSVARFEADSDTAGSRMPDLDSPPIRFACRDHFNRA